MARAPYPLVVVRSSLVTLAACAGVPSTGATTDDLPPAPEGAVPATLVAAGVNVDSPWDPNACPPVGGVEAVVVHDAAQLDAAMALICGGCVGDTLDWSTESALVGHMCGSGCGTGLEVLGARVEPGAFAVDWSRCGSFICDNVTPAYGVYSIPRAQYPELSSAYSPVILTNGTGPGSTCE